MHVLTTQPTWALVVVWLTACAGLAVAARIVMVHLIPADDRPSVGPVAAPLMPALGAAFALLAALSLAGEAGQLRSAEDQVSTEAAAASRLAWAATTPGVAAGPIHDALLAYLQQTRAHEWHGEGAGDPRVLADLAQLERSVRLEAASTQLGSAQAGELLGSLDALTSARRQRLAAAGHHLPGFYVAVVAISGLALVVNSSAVGLAGRRRPALLTGGLVAVVGLALALLFAVSAPFLGGFVVSGGPVDQVIADLSNGVFHG